MSKPHMRAARGSATTGYAEEQCLALRGVLRELGPVLVAFSGGVDSAVLLSAALEELGPEGVLAVTAHGDVHTGEELDAATSTASRLGASHRIVPTHELSIPGFAANSPERCYLCKRDLYSGLVELARGLGIASVVDGANADDQDDFRPGLKAAEECGVRSPLAEAGLGKEEVRALARERGLPEWDLPSSPCLASRFPYGEEITSEALARVAASERYLRGLGVKNLRVRHHGELARIEVDPEALTLLTDPSARRDMVEHLRAQGYRYVTLDLEGFRSGSLNAALGDPAGSAEAPEEET